MDLYHVPTLGLSLMDAIAVVGPRYGVRIEGIPNDANEHSMFWQQVANEILRLEPKARGVTPYPPGEVGT